MDSLCALASTVMNATRAGLVQGVLAQRKPMLLFTLSGVLLLRLAQRALSELLFQLPPRSTRLNSVPAGPSGPGGPTGPY